MLAHHPIEEVEVAPQRTIRQHHALGEAGRAAGVVDEGQLLGAVLVVADVAALEGLRIFFAEELIKMFAREGERL